MLRLPLLLLAWSLSGCAHQLTLVGRDGTEGTGTASVGVGTGTVEATLAGQTYRGRWTAVSDGINAEGTMLAQGDKGGRLRCKFNYGGFTDAGFGACQDDGGRSYDLQMH